MQRDFNQDKLIKEGDLNAFEVFYKLNFRRLVGYARLFLMESDVCEDLVQESFLQIWKKRAAIDENQSLKALVFTIVRNNCLNELKHRKIHEKFIDFALHEEAVDGFYRFDFGLNNVDGEGTDNGSQLIQRVYEAIEALPPKRREVYKKCKIEGLKNSEVASISGISVKGVERHITKANKFIKNFVDRSGP